MKREKKPKLRSQRKNKLNIYRLIKFFKFEEWHKSYLSVSILLFTTIIILVPEKCHIWDTQCWISWSIYIKEHGLANIYSSGTDYLPLYFYILKLYSISQDTIQDISTNIKYLKLVTFFFHLLSTYVLLLIIKHITTSNRLQFGVFYLLNFAVLYNTLLWGQVDEILTFFLVLSIFFCIKQYSTLAWISFVLALNFKLQAIIFFPIIGLVLLPLYFESKPVRLFKDLIAIIIVQVIVILPFILSGKANMVFLNAVNLIDSQPFISANAYNFWHFFHQHDTYKMHDSLQFGILTYKQWGQILFFGISFLALIPLMRYNYLKIFKKTNLNLNSNLIILSSAIIPLIFFYFSTQMHERYSHPSIIFLVIYSISNRKFIFGTLGSIAYFLNLDGKLQSLSFQNYKVLIFNDIFISILYLILITILFLELWKMRKEYQLKTIPR